ncbi:hypothetical protein TNCV_4639651 [Trichonephila clavipes]|nr:hypothetical protein TNCV_4639651 [Trichonephila clavipes]
MRDGRHCALHHGHFDDPLKTANTSDVPSAFTQDIQPIVLTKLMMNFNRRNAICILELYHQPKLEGRRSRNKSFHFRPLLPRYWHEAGPVRQAYD